MMCRWFDRSMADSLSALVREKWSSLLDGGFEIRHEDGHRVALESQSVEVVVVHDPRGEVDVYVFPRGDDERYGWSYTGMVGTASVGRLLEITLAKMHAEPEILGGDAAFYERLAEEIRASSRAWTEFAAGRGPRPGKRKLD
jgi:hypothetical protein